MVTGFGKPLFVFFFPKISDSVSFGNITESSVMMNDMKSTGRFLAILAFWVSPLSLWGEMSIFMSGIKAEISWSSRLWHGYSQDWK